MVRRIFENFSRNFFPFLFRTVGIFFLLIGVGEPVFKELIFRIEKEFVTYRKKKQKKEKN